MPPKKSNLSRKTTAANRVATIRKNETTEEKTARQKQERDRYVLL